MALRTEYEACFVEMVGGLWQRFWFEFFLWFFPLLLEQSRDDFSNHVFFNGVFVFAIDLSFWYYELMSK